MEHNLKTLNSEEFLRLLSGVLQEGATVPLVVSGSSMEPFLTHGRDTVYLSKITGPVKRGDILLYRRRNGELVLHRVLRVNGDTFTMVGDAQQRPEPGIGPEQLLAVVTAVRRDGKLLTRSSLQWKFYEKIWLPARPWRWKLMAAHAVITRKSR